MENNENKKKTALGLDENIVGLLCYLFGWISGLIFLLLEKESRFVKFHAMQSLIVFGGLTVLSIVSGVVPFIGWLIAMLIWPVSLVLAIVLMIKAYKGTMYKLPVVGDIAEKQLEKFNGSSLGG